jgi:hypothetical protein
MLPRKMSTLLEKSHQEFLFSRSRWRLKSLSPPKPVPLAKSKCSIEIGSSCCDGTHTHLGFYVRVSLSCWTPQDQEKSLPPSVSFC